MGGDTIRTDRSALMGGLASSSRSDLRVLKTDKIVSTPAEPDYEIRLEYLWRYNIRYIIPVFHTVSGSTVVLNITDRTITELPGTMDGTEAIKESLQPGNKNKKDLVPTSAISLNKRSILMDNEVVTELDNLIDSRRFFEILRCMVSSLSAPVWIPLLSQPKPSPSIGTVGLTGEFLNAPVLCSNDKMTISTTESTHITVSRDPFQDHSLWVGCLDLNYELLPERADLSPWLPRSSAGIDIYVIGLVGISDRHYEEPMWLSVQVMRHIGKRSYKQIHASIDGEVLLMVVAKHSLVPRLSGISSWAGEISRSEVAIDDNPEDITSTAAAVQMTFDETELCFVCVKIRVLPTDFGSEAVDLKNIITTTLLSAIELGKSTQVDFSCRYHSTVVFGRLGDEILKEVKKGSLLSNFHEGDLVLPRGSSLSQRVFVMNVPGPYGNNTGLEFVTYEAHVPWGIIEEGRHAVKAILKLPVQLPFVQCLSTPSARHGFRITRCSLSTNNSDILELNDERELELLIVSDFSTSEQPLVAESSNDSRLKFSTYDDIHGTSNTTSYLSLRYLIFSVQCRSTQETIGSGTLSLTPVLDSLFNFDDNSEALGANSGVGPDVQFSVQLQKSCKYIDATITGAVSMVVDSGPLEHAMLEKRDRDEQVRQAFINGPDMASSRQAIIDEELELRKLWTARLDVSDSEKPNRANIWQLEQLSRTYLLQQLQISLDEVSERVDLSELLQFSLASFMMIQSATSKMTNASTVALQQLWAEESTAWEEIFSTHLSLYHTHEHGIIVNDEYLDRRLLHINHSEALSRFTLSKEQFRWRVQFNYDFVIFFVDSLFKFTSLQTLIDFDVSETVINEIGVSLTLRNTFETELLEAVEQTQRSIHSNFQSLHHKALVDDAVVLLFEEERSWSLLFDAAVSDIQQIESSQRSLLKAKQTCVFDELFERLTIIKTEDVSNQVLLQSSIESESHAHTAVRIRQDREDTAARHLGEQESTSRDELISEFLSSIEGDLVHQWNDSVRQARHLFESALEVNIQKLLQSETERRISIFDQFTDSRSTTFLTIDVQSDEVRERFEIIQSHNAHCQHLIENEEYLVRDSLQAEYLHMQGLVALWLRSAFSKLNQLHSLKHRSTDLEIFELLTRNQIIFEEHHQTIISHQLHEELRRFWIFTESETAKMMAIGSFLGEQIRLREEDEWHSLTDMVSFPEFPDSHTSVNKEKVLKIAVLQQKLPYTFAGRQRDRHQNRLVVLRSSSLSIYEEKRRIDLTLGCAAGTVPLRRTAFSVSAMKEHSMLEPIILNTESEEEQRQWVSAILGNDITAESGTQTTIDFESNYDLMKSSALAEADRRYSRIAGDLIGKIEGKFELLQTSQAQTEASVIDLVSPPRRVPSAAASPRSTSPKNSPTAVSRSASPISSHTGLNTTDVRDTSSQADRNDIILGRRQIRLSSHQPQRDDSPTFRERKVMEIETDPGSPKSSVAASVPSEYLGSLGAKHYRGISNELSELKQKASVVRIGSSSRSASPPHGDSDVVTVKLSGLSSNNRVEPDQISILQKEVHSLRKLIKFPTSSVGISNQISDIPPSTLLAMISNHEDLPDSIRSAIRSSTPRADTDSAALLAIISRHEELPHSIKKLLKAGATVPATKTKSTSRNTQTSLKQSDLSDMELIMKYANDWEDRSASAVRKVLGVSPKSSHAAILSIYEEHDITVPEGDLPPGVDNPHNSDKGTHIDPSIAKQILEACPDEYRHDIANIFINNNIAIPNKGAVVVKGLRDSDQKISDLLVATPTNSWEAILNGLEELFKIAPSRSLVKEIQTELATYTAKTEDKISEILSVVPNEHWTDVLAALDEICTRPTGVELNLSHVQNQLPAKLQEAMSILKDSIPPTTLSTVVNVLTDCDIPLNKDTLLPIPDEYQPVDEHDAVELLQRNVTANDNSEELTLLTQAVQAARESEMEAHMRSLGLIDKLKRLCYVNKESNVTSEIRNAIHSYESNQPAPIRSLSESPRSGRSIPRLQRIGRADTHPDISSVLAAAEDAACTTDRFLSVLETACRGSDSASSSLVAQIRSAIALFSAEVQFPNTQLSQISIPTASDSDIKVNELNEIIKTLNSDVDDLTTAAAVCQLECERLQQELKVSEKKLKATEKELNTLRKQEETAVSQLHQPPAPTDWTSDDLVSKSLRAKIQSLESENALLRKQPVSDTAVEASLKIKALQLENMNLRKQIQNPHQPTTTPSLKVTTLEGQNASLQNEIERLRSTDSNTEEVTRLREICFEYEQTIQRLQSKAMNSPTQSMTQSDRDTELRRLQYILKQSDERNMKLTAELQACEAELLMSRDDYYALKADLPPTQTIDLLKDELATLQSQNLHLHAALQQKGGIDHFTSDNSHLITPPKDLVDDILTLGHRRLEEQLQKRGDLVELSSAEFEVSKLFSKQRILDTYNYHKKQYETELASSESHQTLLQRLQQSENTNRQLIESRREGFCSAVTSMFFVAYFPGSYSENTQEDAVLKAIVENNNRESTAFQALCQKVSRLSTDIMKPDAFTAGTVVKAKGLESASYLNSKKGIVVGTQDGRYLVRFASPRGDWALQSSNVDLVCPSSFRFRGEISDDVVLAESHRRYGLINLEQSYRCVLLINFMVSEHSPVITDWGSLASMCASVLDQLRDGLS